MIIQVFLVKVMAKFDIRVEGSNFGWLRHDRGMKSALQGYGHIFKILLQLPGKNFIPAGQYKKPQNFKP
jgi:hypothetical protein